MRLCRTFDELIFKDRQVRLNDLHIPGNMSNISNKDGRWNTQRLSLLQNARQSLPDTDAKAQVSPQESKPRYTVCTTPVLSGLQRCPCPVLRGT